MTAKEAIDRSRSHDEIVTIDYDAEVLVALESECDGSVKANGVHEFWGNDSDSENDMLWRVHVLGAPSLEDDPVVDRVNVFRRDCAWCYSAWSNGEFDHGDTLDVSDEASGAEAIAEAKAQFPAAGVHFDGR